jgi:hypothetical protein
MLVQTDLFVEDSVVVAAADFVVKSPIEASGLQWET